MAVQPQRKLTYDDFVKMPDDNLRREIIDGELFVTAAPFTRHQRIVGQLYFRIRQYLEENRAGEIFVAPVDVLFSDFDVVEPDLVFVAASDSRIVTRKNLQGAPTVVIEVMSDPAMDRRRKKQMYEKFGVAEYWIVDPDASSIEVYVLHEGRFQDPVTYTPGQALTSERLPGFVFSISELEELTS